MSKASGSRPPPPSPSRPPPKPSPVPLQDLRTKEKKPALRPLYWVKVARPMQGSLWTDIQKLDEDYKTPEIDKSKLESLFSVASASEKPRTPPQRKSERVHLIDPQRAKNCEIMLMNIKMPLADLMSSLLAMDDGVLDINQINNLIKYCPKKEEMKLLESYTGDKEKLGTCEQFFLELMKIPRVEFTLSAFSFKIQFHTQVADIRDCLNIINSAANEIKSSVKLKRIMQTILSLGNALNQGTVRGSALGFRVDSLLKLIDIRASDNKTTLMHFLCKVLADELPEVLDFQKDLVNLEVASKMQLKFLEEDIQAIEKELEKVQRELTSFEHEGSESDIVWKTLKEFAVIAESEVNSLTGLYSAVVENVDTLVRYFGEDPVRCPFEEVLSTLFQFAKMFKRAYEENCKVLDMEKKMAQKEVKNGMVKSSSRKHE